MCLPPACRAASRLESTAARAQMAAAAGTRMAGRITPAGTHAPLPGRYSVPGAHTAQSCSAAAPWPMVVHPGRHVDGPVALAGQKEPIGQGVAGS